MVAWENCINYFEPVCMSQRTKARIKSIQFLLEEPLISIQSTTQKLDGILCIFQVILL